MQILFSENSTYPIVQAILSDAARAEALIRLWEKQASRSDEDWQVLLVAALLMTGEELPSTVMALSVSAGLWGQRSCEALATLAFALGRLGGPESLPPVFALVVCDALKASSQTLAAVGEGLIST